MKSRITKSSSKATSALATVAKIAAHKQDTILSAEERQGIVTVLRSNDETFTGLVREVVNDNEIEVEDVAEIKKLRAELKGCAAEAGLDANTGRSLISRVFLELGLRERAERTPAKRAAFDPCEDAKRAFANLLGDVDIARLPESFWSDIAKLAAMQNAGTLKSSMLKLGKTAKTVATPANVTKLSAPAKRESKTEIAARIAAKIAGGNGEVTQADKVRIAVNG